MASSAKQTFHLAIIDNSPCRLIFYLDKSRKKQQIPEKNLSKVVKSQNLVENVVMCGKYSLQSLQIFSLLCRVRKFLPFLWPKVVAISARNTIVRKFANFVRLYFPHITTFFNQILEF